MNERTRALSAHISGGRMIITSQEIAVIPLRSFRFGWLTPQLSDVGSDFNRHLFFWDNGSQPSIFLGSGTRDDGEILAVAIADAFSAKRRVKACVAVAVGWLVSVTLLGSFGMTMEFFMSRGRALSSEAGYSLSPMVHEADRSSGGASSPDLRGAAEPHIIPRKLTDGIGHIPPATIRAVTADQTGVFVPLDE